MFQNITQIVKSKKIILVIPSGELWHYLAAKNNQHY